MAVQIRRGDYEDFDPNKLVAGEWAAVMSGDPKATDGKAVYMSFGSGDVKRMATYEDMAQNIDVATEEIQEEFTAELQRKVTEANAATSNANAAASNANEATKNAETATVDANEAAEEARAAAGGDIAAKTVSFVEAEERENIASGDKAAIIFGKIKKWFSDLKAAAFYDVADNLDTTDEGYVLDARQGKTLTDRVGNLNILATTAKESVVGAINEINSRVNELNTNTKNVYTLADSTKVYANATRGTYNYKSVPNMSKYLLLIVHADIGNTSVRLTFFNNDPNAQYISDQLGTPYIRGGILCDWANERIGVRFIEVNNFTYENVSIGSVTGLLPLA